MAAITPGTVFNKKQANARNIDWVKVLAHIILISGSIVFLMPFVYVVSTSLKTAADVYTFPPDFIPDPIQWENYPDALTAMPFDVFFINTILLALGRIAGLTLSCSLAGFAFAKLRWKGRNTLFFVVLLTLMIPTEVTLIPRYILFSKLGWVGTFAPLLVPGFFAENAFFVFLFRQFFMTMGQDLIDAARIDGCSFAGLFWRIIVPNAKPVFAVVAIFIIQNNWNSFLLPMIYSDGSQQIYAGAGLAPFQRAILLTDASADGRLCLCHFANSDPFLLHAALFHSGRCLHRVKGLKHEPRQTGISCS